MKYEGRRMKQAAHVAPNGRFPKLHFDRGEVYAFVSLFARIIVSLRLVNHFFGSGFLEVRVLVARGLSRDRSRGP